MGSQTKPQGIAYAGVFSDTPGWWDEYFQPRLAKVHEGICPNCDLALVVVERPGEVVDRRGHCSCCDGEFATLQDSGWGPGFVTYGTLNCERHHG